MFYINFFILISYTSLASTLIKKPTVRIKQGLIAGVKVFADSGKLVNAYLGIPFAVPPIGPRRFSPPQIHGGWNGTYQATAYGPPCPQLPLRNGSIENENCLFLNIWAPESASEDSPISVVVFFEGSDFSQGNRIPISAQDFAVEEVVVVNVNYRLNIFGFFCLESREARGNMGILDQYIALIWVKDNIRKFGGDNKKVTLFGHSAGAVSSFLHMISIRTADLFQRVIVSTGSIISPWFYYNNVAKISQQIAARLRCSNSYVKNTLTCLRSKSTIEILQAYEEFKLSKNFTADFAPVVDDFLPLNDQYLPFNFENALKSGLSLQVPILIGAANPTNDFNFRHWDLIASKGYTKLKKFVEEVKIPEIMRRYNFGGENQNIIFHLLKWRYVLSSNGNTNTLKKLLQQLYFEAKTEFPIFLQISHLSSFYKAPFYVYYVDHAGLEFNSSDYALSSDLIFLFGPTLFNQASRRRFTYKQHSMSGEIKKMWINFINYGNPTPNYQTKIWADYNKNDNYIQYFTNEDSLGIYRKKFERLRSFYFWETIRNLSLSSNIKNNFTTEISYRNVGLENKHSVYVLTVLVLILSLMLLICIILVKRQRQELRLQFLMNF